MPKCFSYSDPKVATCLLLLSDLCELHRLSFYITLSLSCRIIDGLETLDELEKLPVNEKTFQPLTETRIKDVTIHANPFAG